MSTALDLHILAAGCALLLFLINAVDANAPHGGGAAARRHNEATCSGRVGSMKELIEKKRDGGELSSEEIWAFVSGFHNGSIPDYQVIPRGDNC